MFSKWRLTKGQREAERERTELARATPFPLVPKGRERLMNNNELDSTLKVCCVIAEAAQAGAGGCAVAVSGNWVITSPR